MLQFLGFTLRQLFFWFVFFVAYQLIFLIFIFSDIHSLPIQHILQSFAKGGMMNLAAASYLTVLVTILVFVCLIFDKSYIRTLKIVALVLIFISAFLNFSDLALYENWGSRINGKAIWYLQFPGSLASSAMHFGHLKFLVVVAAFSFLAWKIYVWNLKAFSIQNSKPLQLSFAFMIALFGLFVGLRGGLSGRPIAKSSSYFSKHAGLNYAAVNSIWNFFDVLSHPRPSENPYRFFSRQTLDKMKNSWAEAMNTQHPILSKVAKPNILFIYLESWGADVVGCLNSGKGITPGFDSLATSGLLFSNFYSTGFRTEQGLMATLSGFPAQALSFPMEEMERFENYPNLINELDKMGYYSSYFTGGNPDFANTAGYLKASGITMIHSDLLAKARKRSAWGAFDEETFDWTLATLSRQPKPFFSSVVTLTSHEWFEAGVNQIYNDPDPVCRGYKNTVHYTDSCLFDFIKKASKTEWYKHTLIYIMADHGCTYPNHYKMNQSERYKILMLICGGALREEWKGKINTHFGGHLNLPAMVTSQIPVPRSAFLFSGDIFSDKSFAYFSFDHGFGVLSKDGEAVYDVHMKQNIIPRKSKNEATLLNTGKFIMQSSAQMKLDFQVLRKD